MHKSMALLATMAVAHFSTWVGAESPSPRPFVPMHAPWLRTAPQVAEPRVNGAGELANIADTSAAKHASAAKYANAANHASAAKYANAATTVDGAAPTTGENEPRYHPISTPKDAAASPRAAQSMAPPPLPAPIPVGLQQGGLAPPPPMQPMPMQQGGLAPPPPMQPIPMQPIPMQQGGLAPPPPMQPIPMQQGGLAPPPPMQPMPMQQGGLTPAAAPSAPPSAPPAWTPAGNGSWQPGGPMRPMSALDFEDSRRGIDFVFVGLQGGVTYASLEALHKTEPLATDSVSRSGFGVTGAAKAGLRLLYLTAGPKFQITSFSQFLLWTLNLDFECRIPLGKLEPYALLGAGYARMGNLADPTPGANATRIDGFDIRLGGGIDYYATNLLSVGAGLGVEMIRLSRRASPFARTQMIDPVWRVDASSLGLAMTLSLNATLHF